MDGEEIDALDIYCFETDDHNPSEGSNTLTQNKYNFLSALPEWNK